MKAENNFYDLLKKRTISFKNEKETNSFFLSEMKCKRSDKKNTSIRKNLLSITKEDLKNSNELFIKSYKEDIDLEKLKTDSSLNIINSENKNDDILELNNEEELDLEYSKKKYAYNDCSSSNLSD